VLDIFCSVPILLAMVIETNPAPASNQAKPQRHVVVRRTWLSEKPDASGFLSAALMIFLMAIVSGLYWSNFRNAAELFPAIPRKLFTLVPGENPEWWRLFSSLFSHSDLAHFLSNSLSILMFGSFLFAFFGPVRVFVTAILFGALTNWLTLKYLPPDAKLLGASGIAFWIGGAWLVLYLLIDTKRSWFQRFLRSVGVGLLLFMPSQAFDPSISYRAHFIGFFLGLLWGFFHYWSNARKFKAAEVLEVIEEGDDFLPHLETSP